MDSIISTALSGVSAAQLRLQIAASNVANASTVGALPGSGGNSAAPAAYQPRQVNQQAVPGGGTTTSVTTRDPRAVEQYSPDLPFANPQGLVAAPNVDLVTERMNQLSAINAYRANLRVIQVAQGLDRETIDATRPSRDLTA